MRRWPSASSGSTPQPMPSTRSRPSLCVRSSATSASHGAPPPSRPSGQGPSFAPAWRSCRTSTARCCRSTYVATGAGRFGFTTRIPYGVVAAITPFNGPVNLLVQKIAPAIAVGNAVVVKPSPPGTEVALLMAEAVKKAGVPDGLFNVVPGGRQTAQILVAHPLVAAVTATGSTAAGNELARAAGAKKFVGRARLERRQHRLRRCRPCRRRDPDRRRRLRGERPAMHLGPARDR